MNIKKVNLNTLVALDALLRECSVSRAAKRCFVTQAAMSNTLAQLRDMFGDPLFIRESKGLKPTHKALTLQAKLRQALSSIENVFIEDDFNPKTSTREFRLALSDHGEIIFLPKLYATLADIAPNMRLRIMAYPRGKELVDLLGSSIDLAIGSTDLSIDSLEQKCILNETAICVMSKHHPLSHHKLTLKRYLSLQHLAVNDQAQSASSYIDSQLEALKLHRDLRVTVPNIVTGLRMLAPSNLVGTFPKHLVRALAHDNTLIYKPAPFKVAPCPINMAWHPRLNSDPALLWLLSLIIK